MDNLKSDELRKKAIGVIESTTGEDFQRLTTKLAQRSFSDLTNGWEVWDSHMRHSRDTSTMTEAELTELSDTTKEKYSVVGKSIETLLLSWLALGKELGLLESCDNQKMPLPMPTPPENLVN